MITKQTAFVVNDKMYLTFEEARLAELAALLPKNQGEVNEDVKLATFILEHKEAFMDMARARARKANGGTKNRIKPTLIEHSETGA